jgi:hypothetical protein
MIRVLFIAEWLKYTFAGLLFNLSEGFFSVVSGIIFFLWFLPEMMIGGENPPHHWYTMLARLCAGVVWNLPAALYFSKLLPDKETESLKNQTPPESHSDETVPSSDKTL